MKFIVISHSNDNKLIRCISSICTNKKYKIDIDILYNGTDLKRIKNSIHTLKKLNPDISFCFKKFNIHKRDIYKSVDILMLRKWIKQINNEFIVICNENCIFKSNYIENFFNDIDLHYNNAAADINMFIYGNPVDIEINGNGKCIYKKEILEKIPNMQWRNLKGIHQLYQWCFSEYCQSKIFFENIIEAEANKKFHVIKHDSVIID